MPNLDETPRRSQLHTEALIKVARHLNVAIITEKKLLFGLEMLAFALRKPELCFCVLTNFALSRVMPNVLHYDKKEKNVLSIS